MTQAELLEQAKQGNAAAIAALMNQSLQTKGVTARAMLKDGCLQVMVEALETPHQQFFSNYVYRGVNHLGIAAITQLQVHGRMSGQKTPAWTETFHFNPNDNLETSASPALPETPAQPPAPPTSPPITELPGISSQLPTLKAGNLKELARQGDMEALTKLLNRAVVHKEYTVTADWQGSHLQITVEAPQLPDQSIATTLIVHRELANLRIKSIESVKIEGRQQAQAFVGWSQELIVKPTTADQPTTQYVSLEQLQGSSESAAHESSVYAVNLDPTTARTDVFANDPAAKPVSKTTTDPQKSENRVPLSILCHCSPFLGLVVPIPFFPTILVVVLLTNCKDPVIKGNAREVLNFQISFTLWILGLLVLAILTSFIMPVLALVIVLCLTVIVLSSLVLPIWAALKVMGNTDEIVVYPFVTRFLQ